MENKLNAQNYYAVEFDPNLSIGANEEGEFYLYKDYLNIVNEILSQEGQAPLNFNLASQHIVDKRKNSANLDHYNSIRDEVENTMNSSTLWKKNVPSVQKEKTVNFWSDKLYAVTREVEKQTRGMNLSDNTKQTINELTGEYVKFLRPMWYNWATKENDEFVNSQADGLGKGFFDFASGITRGVDINLPELLGGGDTFWGDWSEDLRKRSEEMAQSTGIYNMSTDELLESKEYSKAFWVMMNHALTSLPQQIPSALSTIPALLGGGGPIGVGAMGLGLGAGYLQESGNFYEDVYDLYTQKRSRAKRLKNSMPESEFKERFGITVDMPDTKLGIGTFKTLDTIDDEQLRQMSEQLAQEYGSWSSGLELVNTIGDVWLGRNAGILKNALMKNPKLAAKQWFKLHWSRPYIQQMGTEGATEFGQEFVSEVKKQANLPEYEINQTQLWESGIIGAMYGTGFQGISDVASRIRDRKTPRVKAPERDFQSYRKGNKELRQHSIIDNDIVIGLHADPMNFTRKVADHHDISEDEVRIRMAELAEIGGLEKGKAKAILRKHPSILESYKSWNDPFAKIEKEKSPFNWTQTEKINKKGNVKLVSKEIEGTDPNTGKKATLKLTFRYEKIDNEWKEVRLQRKSVTTEDGEIKPALGEFFGDPDNNFEGARELKDSDNPDVVFERVKTLFKPKKIAKSTDDLPQADFEFSDIEDPTLAGAYDENLNDPSDIDDPSVNAGLDIGDGHFDVNIEQQHINALRKKIKKLESIDDPNIITRNEKQAQIEQYRLEIEQLEKTLTPEKAQKKRHDSLIAKGKESDELGIVGQKIIVRTKGQNGKMGKILSYEGSNAKVKTNSGIYTISIRNLEFSNPTEAIVNFKKEASTKAGQRKQKSDSTSKNFILKFAKQQGIELTPEEKKLPAQKLKALVRSKKPKTAQAPKQTKEKVVEKEDTGLEKITKAAEEQGLNIEEIKKETPISEVGIGTANKIYTTATAPTQALKDKLEKLYINQKNISSSDKIRQNEIRAYSQNQKMIENIIRELKERGEYKPAPKQTKKVATETKTVKKEWSRYKPKGKDNYEVSTKGDKRFSALIATLSDGRTIEEAYQVGVKGYSSIKEGKGKPPKNKNIDAYTEYKKLWQQWAKENPELLNELRRKSKGKVLTDKFANTDVSQARALAEILNEGPAPNKTEKLVTETKAVKQLVISSWGKVVQELEKTDFYIAWIPKKSQIVDVQIDYAKEVLSEGITEITLQSKSDAHKDVLMLPENKKIIEKVFKKVFGQDIDLKVIEASDRNLDPTVPDDLLDPFEEGTPTSENSLEQMEKLMAEAQDSDPIEKDIIPEKKKVNIVKKVVGKTLNDIVDKADKSDNIDLDDRVPGAPQVKLHGHERKKFEQSMEKMWKQIKNEHRLTNRHFADVANSLNDYFASTPLADAWRLWSQTKINKSGMRKTLSDFGEAIQRATGDLFSDGSIAGDEYQDRIESAIEHVRENIGIVEDSLGDEPMSVKDFTKISRSFFARYDFIINPAKLKEVYDTALKFIQQDAQTAYDKLVEYYSTEENGIYTLMPRRTLAEVLATNDKANIMFKRFFNSIHPDNSGTFNRGEEGQIVEWEFRMFPTASNLEDEKTKKGIKRNFAQFRATEEKGLNQQSRPKVGVLPFYTRFIKDALFSFVKGTDIMTPYNKIYGFLDTNQMWNLYRDELVKRNLVVVASRGEQDKMILTSLSEESSNAVKDISAYILEEVEKWKPFRESDPDKWNYVSNFFKNLFDQSNLDAREQELVDHVFKGNYDLYREHWIAKHMALKKTFGSDYIFMKPETIMKRIKIPFTPVYTSDTLPDRRVMYFDARGAKLKIWDDRTNSETIVELTQKIDGTMQYIGDGQTITSERVFAVDYPEHFGGFRNTKRAKTVQYNIDGDNVHMAKHQEMTLDLNEFQAATLVNNKGKEIAVIAQDQNTGLVNIVDMDGNDIDYLMSDDEAKIKTGNYDKYDTIHLLPGKSIGMIQFTPDSQKNKSKFSTQLSYYFDDQNFQNKIINKYVTLDQGAFSPMNLMTKLIDWNSSGDKINNLIRTFTSRYFDVVPQNVEELGNLGVGRHPTVFPFLRDILKKKMLKPMADFIMDGSHLDFRADFQGRVSQSETIIGPNNFYIKKALKKMGKQKHIYRDFNEKIADINEWLKTNRLYTMITRSPIASSVGFGIYDIKEIDPGIGDSFILHPKEVKERFEGDQDHDTGHLTYIDEEFYEEIYPYMQKTQGLNITQYLRDTLSRDISTLGGTISMIRDMTYGETAIGEVVNAARYAGVMNSMFGADGEIKLMVRGEERRFKIRPLDMQVVDRNIKKEDGEVFKGELKELLRLYLQASVDHPKVLLLRDWEYTQNNLFANLFYEPSSPLSKIDEDIVVFLKSGFINEVLRLNQEMDNMRKGAGESIKFQEIFDKSAQYSQFISDREGYLIKVYEELSIEDELPEGASEEITFIGASFKEGARGRPTSLQELITIIPDRALDKSGVPVERWFNVDSETSRGVHRETLRQIKDEIELIAQEENNGKQFDYTNAKMYAQKLSEALSELFANKRNKNEQDTDENSFLNRMTPKTWDYSDDFIAFYKKWSQEFAKLSKPEQTIASLLFINGVATGLRSHQQLDLRQIPPIKEVGPSTLDSGVMKLYFENYNNNLDEAYKDSDRLKEMRDVKPSQLVNEQKGAFNCG